MTDLGSVGRVSRPGSALSMIRPTNLTLAQRSTPPVAQVCASVMRKRNGPPCCVGSACEPRRYNTTPESTTADNGTLALKLPSLD
jgi:hypothetical protein